MFVPKRDKQHYLLVSDGLGEAELARDSPGHFSNCIKPVNRPLGVINLSV